MPRFNRDAVEIAQIHQLYDKALVEHGCGYYPVCYEHDCFCNPDALVLKGFSIDLWDKMADEFDWAVAEFQRMISAAEMIDDDLEEEDDEDWPDGADW